MKLFLFILKPLCSELTVVIDSARKNFRLNEIKMKSYEVGLCICSCYFTVFLVDVYSLI